VGEVVDLPALPLEADVVLVGDAHGVGGVAVVVDGVDRFLGPGLGGGDRRQQKIRL